MPMLLLMLLGAALSAAEVAPVASESSELNLYSPPLSDGLNAWSGRLLKEEKKPKRKFCNTTTYHLKGDYAYEACGAFCKSAKASNHCKFCKCKACAFCQGVATAAALPAASTATVSSPTPASSPTSSKKKSKLPKAPKGAKGGKKGAKKGGKRKLRKLKESS